MASEWIECPLADACSSIDYGLTASASDQEAGPRFLRITDIVSGHIDWNAVPHVAADTEITAKYRLHDGDVVLARTGASTGASAYVQSPPPAVFASYLVRLTARADFDSRFLAYYLKSDVFRGFIRGVLGDKSAQPNASASTMTKAPLRAPRDKHEQRAIAHILGTLDDKIELNRRMNETLEAMARALFKSWFVDFDPVRTKMAGRDSGLPKPLADLFPARLVASELGEIPEGWEVEVLESALVELEVGGRPRGGVARYTEGVPSIGAESIVGLGIFDYSKTKWVPREIFERMKKGHVKNRDVLLYKDGGRRESSSPM
jgi:type I restriction enzyme S subunit